MSKVAVVFKIYPKEGELDKVMSELNAHLKPAGSQTEDIGFGIKLIKALYKFDDAENSSSKLEEAIKLLPGVGEVEVYEESLL